MQDIPNLELSFAYGRVASSSPAFAECINKAFKGFISFTPPGYGGVNIGPYNPCSYDPPTPSAQTILTSVKTANPTNITCDYSKVGTSTGGYAHVGGVPSNDAYATEAIALGSELGWFNDHTLPCSDAGNDGTGNCVPEQGYAETANTFLHEIMHQHGYGHFEYGNPPDLCGIPASQNPSYANSVPYQVGECIRSVLEYSADNCSIHDCPGGGLKLQDSIFSSTPTCSCVTDPKRSGPLVDLLALSPGNDPLLTSQGGMGLANLVMYGPWVAADGGTNATARVVNNPMPNTTITFSTGSSSYGRGVVGMYVTPSASTPAGTYAVTVEVTDVASKIVRTENVAVRVDPCTSTPPASACAATSVAACGPRSLGCGLTTDCGSCTNGDSCSNGYCCPAGTTYDGATCQAPAPPPPPPTCGTGQVWCDALEECTLPRLCRVRCIGTRCM